jgi:hypothetical protein
LGFAEGIVRRREFIALLAGAAAIGPLGAHAERPPERILYFTYSAGYRHDVVPLSMVILTQLGSNSGVFEVRRYQHEASVINLTTCFMAISFKKPFIDYSPASYPNVNHTSGGPHPEEAGIQRSRSVSCR